MPEFGVVFIAKQCEPSAPELRTAEGEEGTRESVFCDAMFESQVD